MMALCMFAIPNTHNPLLDTTGADCQVDQSGKVFFPCRQRPRQTEAVSRTCTVPTGHMLFFPLITLKDNVAEEAQGNLIGQPVTAAKMGEEDGEE